MVTITGVRMTFHQSVMLELYVTCSYTQRGVWPEEQTQTADTQAREEESSQFVSLEGNVVVSR